MFYQTSYCLRKEAREREREEFTQTNFTELLHSCFTESVHPEVEITSNQIVIWDKTDSVTGAIAGYELGFHGVMASLRLEKASKTIKIIQLLTHYCQGHHQSMSPSDTSTRHLYTSRDGDSSKALDILLHCLTISP